MKSEILIRRNGFQQVNLPNSLEARTENFTVIRQIIFFLKDLMSLRQTAIKVMKGRDDEDQNDE